MISVEFAHPDSANSLTLELPKTTQLKDLQQTLCVFFNKPFPKKLAKVKVYSKIYDEFQEYPFGDVLGEEIQVSVTFEDTTNPYFYDLMDRVALKYTIGDEVEYEDLLSRGETRLTFKQWLKSKCERPLPAIPEYPNF